MLPTEDLFVYGYVLVNDAIAEGRVCIRPDPVPHRSAVTRSCSASRWSAIRWAGAVRRDSCPRSTATGRVFRPSPTTPRSTERTRWLWGAFEQPRSAGRRAGRR
jgi:hypothetical protein